MATTKKKAPVDIKKTAVKKAVAAKKKTSERKSAPRPVVDAPVDAPKMAGPVAAIRSYFVNYFNFRDTSTRAEYWWMWLVLLGVNALLVAVNVPGVIAAAVTAVLFIPSRALAFRRFRDAGLSGWLYLVPMLVLLVWGYVRLLMWGAMVALDYVPLDMEVFAVLALAFMIMCFIVFVQPTKQK